LTILQTRKTFIICQLLCFSIDGPGYYHQVDSDGLNNLAVSILFSRFDGRESIDVSDCTENTGITLFYWNVGIEIISLHIGNKKRQYLSSFADYQSTKPLSDFDVMWKWSGTGTMSMGRMEFEDSYRWTVANIPMD